jgi:pheromone shutdown protein TraB
MRGIGTAIFVGFASILAFGLVAPAVLEPIVEVVVNDPAVQSSQIDASSWTDSLLTSVLVWAPLVVLGSGVASAVVWYLRRERRSTRRVR